MATAKTAGDRLLELLQRLLRWSTTLGEAQNQILVEGIASLWRQTLDGFVDIDEELLTQITDVPESWDLDDLSEEARARFAKLGRICEAPRAFIRDHSADSLFESLIRQVIQLEKRVNMEMGPNAWLLYALLHELEARSRSMAQAQLDETERLIRGIHLRVLSGLSPNLTALELVPATECWFESASDEVRVAASCIIALCVDCAATTPIFLQEWMPPAMIEERFRREAMRLSGFLIEVEAMAP